MKVHLARIAVVLTTISSSVSSALAGHAAGGKAGGGHHAQMRRLAKEDSTTSLLSLDSEHAGSDGNATSLLEKRSYGGQGTYFQPGQGGFLKRRCLSYCDAMRAILTRVASALRCRCVLFVQAPADGPRRLGTT